jgi:hypothetical protein
VNRFRPTLEGLEDRAVPATLTVNTTLDVLGHDNGMLSLRQAIIDANAAPKADTIIVPAGAYTLTRPGINEDAGLTGDLDCGGAMRIQGAGPARPRSMPPAWTGSSTSWLAAMSPSPA